MAERAVLVTGASTGIGRASALRLANAGWKVFAGVRKNADAERLRADAPESLQPLILDVTDAAQVAAARTDIETAASGQLAGLVNNAGISLPGALEFQPLDEFRRQIEVNLTAQLAVTQALLPLLRAARGRIVNITSIGGRVATPFIGAYSASKFGFEAISDALRIELRPWGIHVAAIEPGAIATEIWDKGQAAGDDYESSAPPEALSLYGEQLQAVRNMANVMKKRAVTPDKVAKAVEHALTARRPKTRYVVGFDAHAQRLMSSLLPDRMVDAAISRTMKLPSSA
jgi:NAD(P)-dependent dehydrogenase (short-subunit alcohol dehydrogenase family)